MNRIQTFSAFRYRNFRFLWLSNLSASVGAWVEMVVMGWLVLEMTNSPLLLGLVTGTRWVPTLLFGIIAGVIADRVDRRKLLIITQGVRMLLPIPMAILIITGSIEYWHTLAYALLCGLCMAFAWPSRQALTLDIVGREGLMNAQALNTASMSAMGILGAAAGGILIELIGMGECFYLIAVSYIVAVVLIFMIGEVARTSTPSRESTWRNLIEGLRYITGIKAFLILFSVEMVCDSLGSSYRVLLPVFARDILGIGAAGLGFLSAASGVGGLVAGLGLASLGNFKRKGWLVSGSFLIFGVMIVLFAVSSWYALSLLILAILGAVLRVILAVLFTLVQMIVPDEMRGRALGAYSLVIGAMPVGNLAAGAAAGVVGAPLTVGVAGSLILAYALFLIVKSPTMRRLE